MLRKHVLGSREGRDGLCNARDASAAASGEGEPLDCSRQQLVGSLRAARRTDPERLARGRDASGDGDRWLSRRCGELLREWSRHRYHEIEAVKQGAGELVAEGGQALRRARALHGRVAAAATRTEIHRRHELEARREQGHPLRAGDAHDAILQRLSKRLERGSDEFGQLVEQQHTAMRKAGLAWTRAGPAPDDGGDRRTVVGCPKGRRGDQRTPREQQPGDGMGCVSPRVPRLYQGPGGPPGQAAGSIVLPVPGGPASRRLWVPGGRDLQRAPSSLLASNVG